MKHVLFKVGAIRKLPPCVQGWCDSSSPTFIFSKAQKKNFSREHLIECCWYIECPKGFVPDSESEIKKSLTVTQDLPNDDDAQEVEEIVVLEVSPTLDGEKSSGKKKLAAKTSTTGVSKKSRAIVASVVATGSATIEDTLMGEADSEPFLLTQSHVKVPTRPSLSQHPSSESRPQVLVINDSILKQQQFFREVHKFVVSCSPSRSWRIHGVPSLRGAADLVIADLPEGLPVPTVSVPSSVVPTWNEKSEDYLQELFDFADEILHDNGVLLLFFHLIMESSLRTLRGFMILLALLCVRSGWGSISCPLARQGFPIPPRTDSISFFSSGFRGPRTPCLGLLHFPFVMYQSWWHRVWTLASTTH